MKPQRKIHYWVQYPYHWWCGKKHGWVHEDNLELSASYVRDFHTAKRAFAHAETLPPGSVVVRLWKKNGKRRIDEWVRK